MAERDPLNLSELSASEPPRDFWPAISARLDERRRPGPVPIGIAAGVVLAVLVAASIMFGVSRSPAPTLAELQFRSAYLESVTNTTRPGVLAGEHLVRAAELEAWLTEIDQILQAHPESREWWQERNRTLASLLDTYGHARMQRDLRYTAL